MSKNEGERGLSVMRLKAVHVEIRSKIKKIFVKTSNIREHEAHLNNDNYSNCLVSLKTDMYILVRRCFQQLFALNGCIVFA